MSETHRYATGYIEKRTVDGQDHYFALIETPLFWYGEPRESVAEAKADGRKKCQEIEARVPCFYADN